VVQWLVKGRSSQLKNWEFEILLVFVRIVRWEERRQEGVEGRRSSGFTTRVYQNFEGRSSQLSVEKKFLAFSCFENLFLI